MKTKMIVLSVVLCLTLLLLCACGGSFDKISKAQQQAAQNATILVCEAVVTDNGVTVYKYSKETAVMGNEVSIMTVESKLNSSFTLESKNTSEDKPLDRSLFKSINLSKNLVSETNEQDGVILCKVAKDNISAVLGADVNSATDLEITVKITESVLNSITVNFSTLSGKTVTITYNYQY